MLQTMSFVLRQGYGEDVYEWRPVKYKNTETLMIVFRN
jgi:hypothetical protein